MKNMQVIVIKGFRDKVPKQKERVFREGEILNYVSDLNDEYYESQWFRLPKRMCGFGHTA
jgi:hypothetical protein